MKSIYEQLGGTYSRVGDYDLPNMDIMLTKNVGVRSIDVTHSGLIAEKARKYGLSRRFAVNGEDRI